jgi:hypothetical protein
MNLTKSDKYEQKNVFKNFDMDIKKRKLDAEFESDEKVQKNHLRENFFFNHISTF